MWSLIEARHGSIPPMRTAYGDGDGVIGIRIDATLVNSYSDKQCAAGNFKGGYGFHPLTAWCDNSGECLAIIPRSGSVGSNTAVDHIAIIDAPNERRKITQRYLPTHPSTHVLPGSSLHVTVEHRPSTPGGFELAQASPRLAPDGG